MRVALVLLSLHIVKTLYVTRTGLCGAPFPCVCDPVNEIGLSRLLDGSSFDAILRVVVVVRSAEVD